MTSMKTPKFVKKHLFNYKSVDDIPKSVFNRIKVGISSNNYQHPLVSIVIIAYNEEKGILRTLSSLSEIKSKYPFEIIVVNNNSSDRTQEILDKCGVYSIFEKKQGVGYARQAGLNAAKGTFHLCGDADTIYPPDYVDIMINELKKQGVAAVFGHVSFIPDGNKSRFWLAVYEFFKDIIVMLRAINRPELSLGGASFGFVTEPARKIGWRTDIKRGEDGSMALALKKFGKIERISAFKARIWTSSRTLDADGNLFSMIAKRITRELKRVKEYFTVQKGEYKLKKENSIN